MKVALVGQPNCGKSTLFNAVAGYRSLTSNFAGTTVEYTHGQARINGTVVDLIDLPGLYSLTPTNPVEAVARECLLSGEWDAIINVIDASQLARSLELTLELKDLEAPMVVCLNMMDEAVRKGILIDSRALSTALGVPVVETIAARGQGILDAFRAALGLSQQSSQVSWQPFIYAPEVEATVEGLAHKLSGLNSPPLRGKGSAGGGYMAQPSANHPLGPSLTRGGDSSHTAASIAVAVATEPAPAESVATFPPARFEALQQLQSDPDALAQLPTPAVAAAVRQAQDEITRLLGQPADAAVSSARHAAVLNLFESVARVAHPRRDWREQVDRLVMHPVWGYAVLVLVFLGIFQLIFTAGKFSEDRILGVFNALIAAMTRHMDPHSLLMAASKGALLGTAGAVAIVLPYLLPFLVCLAVLEDLGYLSRVGYLMDVLMHRLGLHGTATLPVLLGYGCSVPAVMATRIFSSRRDRFIAAMLSVLVPCSARMTVIMALVGVYLGAYYALGIYVLNLLVVVLAGHILALIWPEISPGMLMEVPAFRAARAESGPDEDLVAAARVCAGGVPTARSGQRGFKLDRVLWVATGHQCCALALHRTARPATRRGPDTDFRRAEKRTLSPHAHAGAGNHQRGFRHERCANPHLYPLRYILHSLHGHTRLLVPRAGLAPHRCRRHSVAGAGGGHQPGRARSPRSSL